ncbi:DUF2155 domain-containing protein [Acuticoccus sp. MNP-M23]|uniref:DUF2155 domain-containing protein n=1 Tax=Acuticoccus sp. MNP-M23 TaxID=3072793 RepID=UPI00281609C9|nr:DUF2155 domain-containing protein [Acuticoccus sp. MNP-M23]WMS41712.1 DUF2155 domain-containing protein [Acuticoccus sp. MNP-M23]
MMARTGLILALAFAATAAAAEPIENPVATFSGLDKVTGRIISFDVYVNETVQFGALRVTPRTCQTQPPTEEPNTMVFAEVDEITLDSKIRRIFTGWMFAASPGLNAVEHPVYDVWLKNCSVTSDVAPPAGFDEAEYAQDEMGVIQRPAGWFPLPPRRPFRQTAADEPIDLNLIED